MKGTKPGLRDDYPYTFDQKACRSCRGTCCRGSGGYVWVTMEEMERIAAAREMDLATFSNIYMRTVQGKLALQERRINGEHLCCFFDPIDGMCSIYPDRPEQCRTYPFWEIYRDYPDRVRKACPGVTVVVD